MSDDPPIARRRARFSLLTLLLVTAIVALSVTVAMLYRELGPLRAEVVRLRNEVGELHVNDPAKLHAIRVETDSELEWKWRIWLPEGATYRLRGEGGPVPETGFPATGGTMYLREPGEHVIRYVIRRDPRDGKWYGSLHAQNGSVGKDLQPWVEWGSRTSTSSGVERRTQSFHPDETVVLIRHRVSQKDSSEKMEKAAEGLMVWLEPE
jgi:hypothetical protein